MLSKGFGGAERFFVDLSLALARRGHDIQALVDRRFMGRDRLENTNNISIVPVSVLGTWDSLAIARLRRHVAAYRPDILQGHLARAAKFAGAAARRLSIPLVVKTHNYVDLKYYRHVDRFVTTTVDQRNYLIGQGVGPQHVQVIPNFSALEVLPVQMPREHEPLRFVSYGRGVRKKGFDLLLRAFRQFLNTGRDADLTLAGEGPELSALKALCTHLNMNDKVSFPGWVDDVRGLLEGKSVFVLPSYDEPFGIVILEAMAAGIPIVSTRSKGPSETLDTKTAYLCDIGDQDGLCQAMIEAGSDPVARHEMAFLAQQRYVDLYSESAVVPQYEAVYRDLARS